MKPRLIENARLVNENRIFKGSLVVEGRNILDVIPEEAHISVPYEDVTDACGAYLLPGVIDEHVHFREPGLTEKGNIYSESRAAAAGGVTSFFDMPNTKPQTTTFEALKEKKDIAARNSMINYSFFFGATGDNIDLLPQIDAHTTCGVKLFMGASTGNMLVDQEDVLMRIFRESPLLIMTHCEDMGILERNTELIRKLYGEPSVELHPLIRSAEACYKSTAYAISLAKKTGARLHVAHISTRQELELFKPYDTKITAETCVSYLFFSDKDYPILGTKIKCNPSIKTEKDRDALRKNLSNGIITTIGTDHAPHLFCDKWGGSLQAASGMPGVQFSLVSMLELCDKKILSMEQLVNLMCHNPARLFKIQRRGFLRPGYRADFVLVRPQKPWIVSKENILSPCKWSPYEGHTYNWRVEQTFCNGQKVFDYRTGIGNIPAGEEILFHTSL